MTDIRELTNTCVLRPAQDIVARKIYDAYFLIDITDSYSQDRCALYEINEIGHFIWAHMDGSRSVTDIALELQKAITDEIPVQILIDDTHEFVQTLVAKGFVEV